ncbi:MAG: ABC transporter permease [Spirochaetaceae bacterium]|jgi:peptide/nickel transport system permease protein|nr:ABC transporter permease [Spirochaetaceae bacterium]
MFRYVLKRLLLFIPLAMAVVFIVYFIMDFTPGDPARLILGERADESQLAILRKDLGLDRPFPARYIDYLYRLVFHGDWGVSYRSRIPVITEILRKAPNTFVLALLGAFFSSIIGVGLGILAAVKRGKAADILANTLTVLCASVPAFVLGMVLILIFALRFRALPSNGASSWRHFILPLIALSIPASAGILRLTRSMMLEKLGTDYIRTARTKGLGEGRVVLVHALKNAIIPVITSMGMHLGYLLGGAVITETVFAIPGLGTHIIDAIRMKDTPVVLAATVFLSLSFSFIMLIVDILCVFLDPRLRVRFNGRGGVRFDTGRIVRSNTKRSGR